MVKVTIATTDKRETVMAAPAKTVRKSLTKTA